MATVARSVDASPALAGHHARHVKPMLAKETCMDHSTVSALLVRALTASILVSLAACGGGASSTATPGPVAAPAPAPEPAPAPAPAPAPTAAEPTAIGQPLDAMASAVIGPAGGTLASADGRLRVTVPAGAFSSDQVVAIQPIENLAHGAKGGAWRITPEGLQAAQPITLTFHVGAAEREGSALDLLTIATQDAQGRWRGFRAPQRNVAAGTLSVSTRHFSDWAMVAGVQLRPARTQLAVGQGLDLQLVDCPLLGGDADDGTALIGTCAHLQALATEVDHWAVNGTPGGAAGIGTVVPATPTSGADSNAARYTAPPVKPASNPVAVSVDYTPLVAGPRATQRLVSNVQIVDAGDCSWLHNLATLDYEAEMAYAFSASAGGAAIALNHSGRIRGRMQRVFDNDLQGVWQGLTTEGFVSLKDSLTNGAQSASLFGSGQPVIGDSNGLTSGAQLVVDYQRCTYTFGAAMGVLASSGQPNDPPHQVKVGSFQRGEMPIPGGIADLLAEMQGSPHLDATPAFNYAPGGLGGPLFSEGYAQPGQAGTARARWAIVPR
jgi:hypothetical protein